MVEKRDVQLLIRASDLSSKPLRDIAAAVDQMTASLARQVTAAEQGKASLGELKQTLQQLQEAGKALAQQQGLIDLYTRLGERLAQAQTKAEAARTAFAAFKSTLDGGGEATAKQTRELEKLGRAADRAETSVVRAAAAVAKQKTALEGVGVDTNNLTAAQTALVAAAERVGTSIKTASDSMAAFGENARKAKAAADLSSFRGLADQAQANVRGVGGLPAGPGRATGVDSAAASLRAIVDPAAAARATLTGVEQTVSQLSAEARTAGGTIQQYASTLRGLAQASQAIVSQGGAVDAFQRQVAGVRAARTAFENARDTFNGYARAVKSAAAPDDELAASLRRTQAALQAAGAALTAQVAQARAFREALTQAGVSTRTLASDQQRLQDAATKTAAAMKAAQTQVSALTGPQGYKGPPTIFGLRPYELQNLGFQINDVFTQIASGTSVTQTLAQQGGQILQIFPGAFSAVARLLPGILVVGTAAIAALASVNRLLETAASLRQFSGILAASSEGSRYQAGSLVEAARAAQAYGASFADAGAAIRTFVQNDINPARITQFARAAQDLIDVYGGKLPDAAKTVAEAFTKDYDAIIKLNQEYNFLTPTVAARIQQLYDEGKAEEARALGFETFRAKMAAGAQEARSDWTNATRAFAAAWGSMLEQLGNSSAVVAAVELMTKAVRNATASFRELTKEQQIAQSTSRIAELQGKIANLRAEPGPGGVPLPGAAVEIRSYQAEIDKLYGSITQLSNAQAQQTQTQNAATAATITGNEAVRTGRRDKDDLGAATNRSLIAGAQAIRQQDEEILRRIATRDLTKAQIQELVRLAAQKARDAALAKGADAASADFIAARARLAEQQRINAELGRQGAAEFNAARSREEALLNLLTGMEKKITGNQKAELEDRVKQYDDALKKILLLVEDARRKGSKGVLGQSFEEFTARAVTATDNGKTLELLKASEQQLNELIRERNDLVATNNARFAEGQISQTQANDENRTAYAQTAQGIQEAADKWLEFAQKARDAGLISETAMARVAARVKLVGQQTQFVDPAIRELERTIRDSFAQNTLTYFNDLATAFGEFIVGTKTLGQTFTALGQVTAKFFAGLLKDIAAAILKMQLLKTFDGLFPSLGLGSLFGGGGAAAGGTQAIAGGGFTILHAGGVVGSSGSSRFAPAALLAHAPRYHSGYTGVGLQHNERAAILQTGEEVLSRDSPRNMKNWKSDGGAAQTAQTIRNVLVMSPDFVAEAMSGSSGEQVIMTVLNRNAARVRQLVR